MTVRPRPRSSPARTNLWIDVLLLVAMLLALAPAFTGIPIHEWLSVTLWAGIAIHLLLHWAWTMNAFRRIVGRLPSATRLNFWLNILFFVALTVVMVSGILISRAVLPTFGIQPVVDRSWSQLHRISADWLVFLTAAHAALHWRWIVTTVRRHLVDPVARVVRPRPVAAGGDAA